MSIKEARYDVITVSDELKEYALDRLILEVEASFDCDQYDPGRGYEKSCSEMGSLPVCRSCQAREKLEGGGMSVAHPLIDPTTHDGYAEYTRRGRMSAEDSTPVYRGGTGGRMIARIFIRSEHAPDWRELYASTYPAHRLSFNAWLEAVILVGIAAIEGAAK